MTLKFVPKYSQVFCESTCISSTFEELVNQQKTMPDFHLDNLPGTQAVPVIFQVVVDSSEVAFHPLSDAVALLCTQAPSQVLNVLVQTSLETSYGSLTPVHLAVVLPEDVEGLLEDFLCGCFGILPLDFVAVDPFVVGEIGHMADAL